MKSAEIPMVRAPLTAAQIGAFMPSRGEFTFPAPYNTLALRITNASSCGGTACAEQPKSDLDGSRLDTLIARIPY